MKKSKWLLVVLVGGPLLLAIWLWSAASWRPHKIGVHPNAPPRSVAGYGSFSLMLSPDGTRLLSFWRGESGRARSGPALWDVASQRLLWQLPQRGDLDWKPLCFSLDGTRVAMSHNPADPFGSIPAKPELAIFDAQSGRQILVKPFRREAVSFQSARFSSDGRRLLAANRNAIYRWNLDAQSAATKDASSVVYASPDNNLSADVVFAPDARRIALNWSYVSSLPTPPTLLEVRDASGRLKWKIGRPDWTRMLFSPDDRQLLLRTPVKTGFEFELRDAATGRLIWKRVVSQTSLPSTVWSPDSKSLLVSVPHEVQILHAVSGQMTARVSRGDQNPNQQWAISPDGARLWGIDDKGVISRQRLR